MKIGLPALRFCAFGAGVRSSVCHVARTLLFSKATRRSRGGIHGPGIDPDHRKLAHGHLYILRCHKNLAELNAVQEIESEENAHVNAGIDTKRRLKSHNIVERSVEPTSGRFGCQATTVSPTDSGPDPSRTDPSPLRQPGRASTMTGSAAFLLHVLISMNRRERIQVPAQDTGGNRREQRNS